MRLLVVAGLLALVVMPGLALEQEQQGRPVFRTRTDLIELDVSVLDKNRRPVRGLTAADFIVLEDGVEQPISVFEPVNVPDPAEPPAAWMRDVTPDVSTNESKGSRLWVLVIDDALIPYRPFATKSSAELARDVIRRLGPDDLATIVFTTDSSKAQDFTNDRSKLLATLEGYRPGWAAGHGSPDGVIDVNPDLAVPTRFASDRSQRGGHADFGGPYAQSAHMDYARCWEPRLYLPTNGSTSLSTNGFANHGSPAGATADD